MLLIILIQSEYHLIDALYYFIAAAVPIYFLIVSRNSINNPLKKVMLILACFVLAQATYHIAGILGLNLLSKVILEPLSSAVLASAAVVYFFTMRKTRIQQENSSLANYSIAIITIITIISGIIIANGPSLIFSASILTSTLFLFSFAILAMLAIKSRTFKSFQSQISIFAGVYVIGEVLELNTVQNLTRLPADLGSQIHVIATIIIAGVFWSRLIYSSRSVKKLVDREQSPND
jgi:hypothetical protein